jgi:hypothetical protein
MEFNGCEFLIANFKAANISEFTVMKVSEFVDYVKSARYICLKRFILSESNIHLAKPILATSIYRKDADKLDKISQFREATKRVKLGPDRLPSICFYTFQNANQG